MSAERDRGYDFESIDDDGNLTFVNEGGSIRLAAMTRQPARLDVDAAVAVHARTLVSNVFKMATPLMACHPKRAWRIQALMP